MNNTSPFIQTNTLVTLAEREALLLDLPGFSNLHVNDVGTLIGLMHEVQFEIGEQIVTESAIVDSVYIMVSGIAEVTHELLINDKTWSTLFATLYKGDSIGLIGNHFLSTTGLRTATVTATSACILLKITALDLQAFLHSRPHILSALNPENNLMLRMRLIRQAAPFIKLNHQQLAGLTGEIKERTVEANQIIFRQGDPVDAFYLICSGTIEISNRVEHEEHILNVFEPYYIFGVQEFVKYARRNTSARAITDCQLLVMDKELLSELGADKYVEVDPLLILNQDRCRPMRYDGIVYQHRKTAEGQVITTLKNITTTQYLQLSEEGWFLWTQMDGNKTLSELSQLLYKKFGKTDVDEVKSITEQLYASGFVSIDNEEELNDSDVETKRLSWNNRIINFDYFFKRPDKKLTFLYDCFGFLFFNIPSVLLQSLLCIIGIIVFYNAFNPVLINIKTIESPLYILLITAFTKGITELTTPFVKGLTIKHYRGVVPQLGII